MVECEFPFVSPQEPSAVTNSPLIDMAGTWLLQSGIQQPSGGVARYYRADLEKNWPVSTEITGYTVSTLAYLHALTAEDEYLEAAQRAADFLVQQAWDEQLGIFPFECGDGAAPHPPAYFFDCGIIVRGLLSIWRTTGKAEYLETARRCGEGMHRDFVSAEAIHPILVLPDKQPAVYGATWSSNPGCFQLKAAMAWLELHEATGMEQFGGWYEDSLARALATHEDFLPGTPEQQRVMDRLHAYCYFLEGLLPRAREREYAQVLAAGIQRVAALLREIAPEFERSDVNAQLLRVRLYATALGVVPLDAQAAEEEARSVSSFQYTQDDVRLYGGFCFGRRGEELLPYANPISTAFCLQALEMWRASQAGEFSPTIPVLI